ncbi:hypothetical protein [Haloprofundus sp. MHR1]|uniref:hypothetical protein n=1 Tax=Haloprofundus sp. MHR1 TaxID=2572921 RepID=UPI0010BE87A9|nr:hypothetical protein [Haloprofundus sp. MHR1]QCJ46398.1 hypothetical protein FCF25_04355 [Haloprofundus sp. MHR1]
MSLGGASVGTLGVESVQAVTTVFEDFENDLGNYTFASGQSGATTVTSPTYSGSYALEIDNTDTELYSVSGLDDYPQAGDTFSYRVRATGGADTVNFGYGVTNDNKQYLVKIHFPNSNVFLYKEDSGSTLLGSATTGFSLSEDSWYEVEVDWSTNGDHTVTVLDDSGSTITTFSGNDSTWSDGGIGFYAYIASGGRAYFDYVAQSDTGGTPTPPSIPVIDDFEDGNLSEYTFSYGESGASIVSQPVFEGSNALEIDGTNTELYSESGLENYPCPGDIFSYRVRATGGADSLNFGYGVQGDMGKYYVKLHFPNDNLFLYKESAGGGNDLLAVSTSGFSLSEDVWYQVKIKWGGEGEHKVTVYDESNTAITTISAEDWTWRDGGIGYYAYIASGGSAYYDNVVIDETTALGRFESEMDGWETSNGNSISRVNGDIAGVARDSHTLEVSVNGDSEPSIQNELRLQQVNCSNHPHVLAHVLPMSVEGSDSPVSFRFRYHHGDTGGVEESPEMIVDQGCSMQIAWDMSSVSDTALATPERIEIVWYPTDHPPADGFAYNGTVYIDNVYMTAVKNDVTYARNVCKHQDLERAHGMRVDEIIDTQSSTVQTGRYKYSNAAEVTYRIEKLGNGDIEETVDGDTFLWKGGAQ